MTDSESGSSTFSTMIAAGRWIRAYASMARMSRDASSQSASAFPPFAHESVREREHVVLVASAVCRAVCRVRGLMERAGPVWGIYVKL